MDSPTFELTGLLVLVVTIAGMIGGGISFGTRETEDRLEREQVLDDPDGADVEIGVVTGRATAR